MAGAGRDGDSRDWALRGVPWLTPSSHAQGGRVGGGWPRMARSGWGRKVLQGHLLLPLFLPVVQELSPSLPWGGEVLLLVGSGLFGGQSWLSS